MRMDFNVLEQRARELVESSRWREAMRIYLFMADGDPSLDAGYLGERIAECYKAIGNLYSARYWYGRGRRRKSRGADQERCSAQFAYAFASIVLITYMSTLTATEHAASQYALLTSLCALPGSLLAGASGFLIEYFSFEWFFVMTSLLGVPVAFVCWHVRRLQEGAARAAG